MINFLLKYFFIKLFIFKIGSNKHKNFNDLNFKQNDFVNYKIIKNYIVRENFIQNDLIFDVHTFNFLFFYQRLGGKKGINLSKKNIFCGLKNTNIIEIIHGQMILPQRDLLILFIIMILYVQYQISEKQN